MMKALDVFAALPQDRKEEITKRFWSKVSKESEEGCWEWVACKGKDGYGKSDFVNNRKQFTLSSHRMAWFLENREIPADGLCVCHRCDNPSCVNPNHLFVGTHDQNVKDKVEKKRQAWGTTHGSRLHPEKLARGDKHWSRLNPEKMARGSTHGARLRPETISRGESHKNSKLNEAKVLKIRSNYAAGGVSMEKLSLEFGVRRAAIRMVVRRMSWAHVDS